MKDRSMAALLRMKGALIGSPLEGVAKRIQWALGWRYRTTHEEVWEVFLEDKLLPRVLQRVLTNNSNIVDVGCHIGAFINNASKYSPNGMHVIVEPTPSKCAILRKNFPNARLHETAISNVSGSAVFEENLAISGYSRLRAETPSQYKTNSYEVKVSRLDDIITDRMDLLKIDIEGGEIDAMKGGKSVISRYKPTIIFECGSDQSLIEIGKSRQELYEFIVGDLGYSVYTFSDFLFDKGPLGFDEFRKCGLYPFRAFNYVAEPAR
jgi:FkbM family methyltransferase